MVWAVLGAARKAPGAADALRKSWTVVWMVGCAVVGLDVVVGAVGPVGLADVGSDVGRFVGAAVGVGYTHMHRTPLQHVLKLHASELVCQMVPPLETVEPYIPAAGADVVVQLLHVDGALTWPLVPHPVQ